MKKLENIFKSDYYNKNINFIEIETEIFKKEIENTENYEEKIKQFHFEIENYNQIKKYNKELFNKISSVLFGYLENTDNFSKEKIIMGELLKLNKNKINSINKNYCHISFTSQLITNWFLSSLNTSFIDKSYFDKNNNIYFNKYELINKISNNFRMYFWFFSDFHNDSIKSKKDIKHLIFSIIIIFQKNEILGKFEKQINIKKVYTKGNTKEDTNNSENVSIKNRIKTQIFYYLMDYNKNTENNNINFNIFLNKPNIKIIRNIYFLGGAHYSTFHKVFKSNLKSNKIFNLSDKKLINKICSLKYNLDFSFYKKIYNLICKDLNIQEYEHNKNSLECYLKENIKDIYNKKLFDELDNKQTEEEEENEKKIFQQKYSKLLEYYLFLEIGKKLNNLDSFYLGLHFDFRGRMYPKSCISPTGNKIIRFLYFYGYYTEDELKLIHIKDVNNNYKNIINNCLLVKLFDKIKTNNKIHEYYIYTCLFEIGKIFKNELSLKNKGVFNDMDLIRFGCEISNDIIKNYKKLSFDEELEYIYIISALEDLNKGLYKKLIIYKDATASGIQLLTVANGSVNETIIKNCNLKSYDMWYDTYLYIINIFINKNIKKLKKLVGDDYIYFVRRKDLKRSIMTYIYGAGKNTALSYYLDNLPKRLDENTGIKIFNLFYKFLNKFFASSDFFETSIDFIKERAELEQNKNKKILVWVTDDSTMNLDYYKIIYYRMDRYIDNDKSTRSTIKFGELDDKFDKNKTLRALIANIAQGLDALFLRLIIKELDYPIITIHDSFGIDILRVNYLIKVVNIAINKISYSFESDFKSFNHFKLNNYYSEYILL